jgi:hypothetical protein
MLNSCRVLLQESMCDACYISYGGLDRYARQLYIQRGYGEDQEYIRIKYWRLALARSDKLCDASMHSPRVPATGPLTPWTAYRCCLSTACSLTNTTTHEQAVPAKPLKCGASLLHSARA